MVWNFLDFYYELITLGNNFIKISAGFLELFQDRPLISQHFD